MLKKHVLGSLNHNNSEIFRLSSEDIFLGTLDTYTKKNEPTLGSSGGGVGVHGKVCLLIAYILVCMLEYSHAFLIHAICMISGLLCHYKMPFGVDLPQLMLLSVLICDNVNP